MAEVVNQSGFPESTGPKIFPIPTLYSVGVKSLVTNTAACTAKEWLQGAIQTSKIALSLLAFHTDD